MSEPKGPVQRDGNQSETIATAATTTIDPMSTSSTSVNAHVKGIDGEVTRKAMEKRLQNDHIARRMALFQEAGLKVPGSSLSTNVSPYWLGTSALERILVSQCQDDNNGVPGAVGHDAAAVNFVRVAALYCHDIASRALALAVLERSLRADSLEQTSSTQSASQESDNSNTMATDTCDVTSKEPNDNPPQTPRNMPSRMQSVFAAGGLKLLRQWLVDATTPIKSTQASGTPSSSSSSSAKDKHTTERASATSALLLPLLDFFCQMPFEWHRIEQAQLDKSINKLRRQVKKLSEEKNRDAAWNQKTSLLLGHASVEDVKKVLDGLRSTWKKAYESMNNEKEADDDDITTNQQDEHGPGPANPFQALQKKLLECRAVLESGDSSEDKPEWFRQLQEKSGKREQKRKRKRLSTAEMEKLEREKERSAMLKEDLEKALAYKRQCQAKLRELEKKKQDEKLGISVSDSRSKSKNRVRWKDGMSTLTGGRNRAMLEEVFFIEGRKVKIQPQDSL